MHHTPPSPPYRARVPWGVVALVVGLLALVLLVRELRTTFDPIERERRAQEAQEAQARDRALSWLNLVVAGGWRVFPIVLLSGAAGISGVIAYRRYASIELLKADRVIELQRAAAQRFPEHLQHLSFHDSSRPMLAPPAEQPPEAPALPAGIPTFAQLLDNSTIGAGRPLILGYDATTGQPIAGDWKSLYSCGIGALQGAGKSWLAAFLLAQSALQGGRLIICDRHAEGGNDESLGTRIAALSPAFMCDVATTPDDILSALKLASDKLQQRIAGKGGTWPIIVAIDEWTSLLRTKVGAVLPAYLEDISEQGRKFNVNALLSAQGWTKDTAGVVRNRLTSHYVMRQRPDEARYQLGLPASIVPEDVRLLGEAEAYLLDVRGNLIRVIIPHMTTADLLRAGAMIPERVSAEGRKFGLQPTSRSLAPTAKISSSKAANKQQISSPEAPSEVASGAIGRHRLISSEAARVYAAWKAGRDVTELAKEANGGSSSGPPYQEKLRQINALLREATPED